MQPSVEVSEPKSSMSLGMLGMILVLVAIGAFFVALAVAYAFAIQDRPGQSNLHLSLWFWISTGFILLSSVTLQWARRDLRLARFDGYCRGLWVTLGLGVAFLVAQILGCIDLAGQGLYVVGNPRGSMYYVFSGIHGAHLLGGLGGMYWLVRKGMLLSDGEEQPLRKHRAAARNTAAYWHFMGVLWVGLFILLVVWR